MGRPPRTFIRSQFLFHTSPLNIGSLPALPWLLVPVQPGANLPEHVVLVGYLPKNTMDSSSRSIAPLR
jgi:hypothetical protein